MAFEGPVTATFYAAGVHGWHAVQGGNGSYMQYDGLTGLKYRSVAVKDAAGNYTAVVPDDICGDVILPQGGIIPTAKIIEVTLADNSGNPIPGVSPTDLV